MVSPEVLRRYPMFAGINGCLLKKIAMLSQAREFEAGDRLFEEGNLASHFMIIMNGEVDIVYQLGDGREVVADTLIAGDPLAWSALLEPHKLTGSGVANKDGSLIEIPGEGLLQLFRESTDLVYVMLNEVAKTLRNRLNAMRVVVAAANGEPVRV